MDKNELDALLKKYENGTCTEEERQAIEQWYNTYDAAQKDETDAALNDQQSRALYANMVERLKQEGEWSPQKTPLTRRRLVRWAAAAAVIFMAGTIYFMPAAYNKQATPSSARADTGRFRNDIAPGGNKAVLVLADGSRIILDNLQNGNIAKQGTANIVKLDAGQLSYHTDLNRTAEILYNTLITPRGGQYEIILPDGSKAWLNASSTLRFPTTFIEKDRVVELSGEAYFEIAPLPSKTGKGKMPFIVKINKPHGQRSQVEVLGTHFNVMAYTNEQLDKITLLEGSVNVSKAMQHTKLVPGQQASFSPGNTSINVARVDTEEAVAWKNNFFWFHDADIKTVMRQIERWYDVEVIFEGNVTKHFNGSIPRNMSAIKVLNILEMTGGVRFGIDGKKISVLP